MAAIELASILGFVIAARARAAPVYATREEALARAFPPPATVERKSLFLTTEQRERVSRLARVKVDSSLVVAYIGRKGGELLGTAYFDTHLVRTQTETLLVTVAPDGSVGSVEVVAFSEPEDYLPRPAWLKLFARRKLDDDLSVGRGLAHVTGATLTTRAIADAVRRVLAIHAVLRPEGRP
jgi:Na+-translocating ferredoxin:NAD+ oxidoreductase RnfG subunit